jgi:hypothetical protein
MKGTLVMLGFMAAWIALNKFLLPKMGIPT